MSGMREGEKCVSVWYECVVELAVMGGAGCRGREEQGDESRAEN